MMKKIVVFVTALSVLQIAPIVAATKEVRICANIKSGKAKIVTAAKSCKKAEVQLLLPTDELEATISVAPSNTVLNGKNKPVDNTTGKDGDFYIDLTEKKFYGPRTSGIWGDGFELIGPRGYSGGGGGGAQGPQGIKGDPGGFGYYLSCYDTSTVDLIINTATVIPCNTTSFSSGIALLNSNTFKFNYAGKYNLAFSSQIFKEDAGTDTVTIWLRKSTDDGATWSNVSWTSTDLKMVGTDAWHVAAWNFFLDVTALHQYQLMISSNGTTLKTHIKSQVAQLNPSRPEIPGTIITINQVG